MVNIAEYYHPFGKSVIAEVQLTVNRHGDLRPLLTRFNVPVPADTDAQHDCLRKLLERYGPLFFMSIAKSDWSPEQVEKMKHNVQRTTSTPSPDRPRPGNMYQATQPMLPTDRIPSAGRPRSPYNPANRSETGSGSASATPPGTHSDANYRGPERRVKTDRRAGMPLRATAPPLPPAAPEAPVIHENGYDGPERRVNAERRQGPQDRRHDLQIVFKNKRYGGRDRRKTVRRSADRTKGKGNGSHG